MTDSQRLDWLESLMKSGENYVEIYFAGLRNHPSAKAISYQVELQNKSAVSGKTLREAIDEAYNKYSDPIGI